MSYSLDSLQRRYDGLNTNSNKLEKIKKIAGRFVFSSIILLFGLLGLSDFFELDLSPAFVLFVFVPMGIAVYLMNYSNRYIMKSEDFRFFRFFDAYIKLLTFKDTKLKDDKINAVRSIISLANLISGWTINAPKDISELPDHVGNELKSKIGNAITQEKYDLIDSFVNSLPSILMGISTQDVKTSHLEALKNDLSSYDIKTEPIKTKPKGTLGSKIWKLKYVLIIIGSITLFVTSQILQEIQIGELLESVLIFALALIGVLGTLYTLERKTASKISHPHSQLNGIT